MPRPANAFLSGLLPFAVLIKRARTHTSHITLYSIHLLQAIGVSAVAAVAAVATAAAAAAITINPTLGDVSAPQSDFLWLVISVGLRFDLALNPGRVIRGPLLPQPKHPLLLACNE